MQVCTVLGKYSLPVIYLNTEVYKSKRNNCLELVLTVQREEKKEGSRNNMCPTRKTFYFWLAKSNKQQLSKRNCNQSCTINKFIFIRRKAAVLTVELILTKMK